MYCFFCGKENKEEQKFCKYCGKSLHPGMGQQEKTEKIAEERQSIIDTVTDTSMPESIVDLRPDSIRYENESGGVNKLLVVIIILLLLVLISLGACLFIYIKSDEKSIFPATDKVQEEAGEEVGDDRVDSASEDSAEEKITDEEPANVETINDTESASDETVVDSEKSVKKDVAEYEQTDEINDSERMQNESVEKEDVDNEDEEKSIENEMDKKLNIVYAEASSVLNVTSKDHATYGADNVCDGNYKTAWVEGVDGNGEGQSIVLHLDGVHNISRLKIFNGFLKSKRRYAINGRTETAVIDYGNGHQQKVNLNLLNPAEEETAFATDEMGETVIEPGFDCETDTITITIMSVVQGSKYTDTAISEIEVEGR